MAKFLVSIGDSDKYLVEFEGDKKAFENSECMKDLYAKIDSYLKEKFPTGGFKDLVKSEVVEDDAAKGYTKLDASSIPALLEDAARQVEVMRRTDMQNLNAPFDQD